MGRRANSRIVVPIGHRPPSDPNMKPLDYMLSVLRNEESGEVARRWAAASAAPYCHPKLAVVEHTGPGGGNFVVEVMHFSSNTPKPVVIEYAPEKQSDAPEPPALADKSNGNDQRPDEQST